MKAISWLISLISILLYMTGEKHLHCWTASFQI